MTEYIEREAVLNILASKNAPWDGYQKVSELPIADVQPVNHGKWIPRILPLNKAGNECSACLAISVGAMKPYYCPSCGAIMDRGDF